MKKLIVPIVVSGIAAGVLAFVGPQAAKADTLLYGNDILPSACDSTMLTTPVTSSVIVPNTIDSSVVVGDPYFNNGFYDNRGLLDVRSPILDLDLF